MKYNFAIIEDNVETRRMISDYFTGSEKLECVLAVDSIEKFLKYHRDFLEIKLVLLDVELGVQSSIYQIPQILQREPEAEIIMFTVHDDSNTILKALTYGATGYLLKDIRMEELEESLLTAIQGNGALLSPAVAKKIIQQFSNPNSLKTTDENNLTEKEIKVAHLLKEGRSYEEIAARLGLSVNGIRYYVKGVYKKLQINSRGELARLHKAFEQAPPNSLNSTH